MIKRLPNGNLLYLQGRLTPYQAQKRMEEDAKRSTQEDGRNLFTEMFGDSMTITAATSADWVDFWENELTIKTDMNQEQITAMLSVSEQIQEGIEIAGELWELSDFEVTALCGIVADAFAEQGIKMEALI